MAKTFFCFPEIRWYQTLLPPKSTCQAVYEFAGLISA